MQSFPTSYTPQSGYPTHGPYGPDGEQIEQLPSGNPQSPPPQDIQMQQPPQQPQPSYMAQVIPPPLQSTGYSYYPQQQQIMEQYPQRPQYPSQPDYYSESESKDDNECDDDDECHEVIGITLGGKSCPARQDPVVCCGCRVHSKPTTNVKKFKRSKPKEKPKVGESLCAHTFCIVERAKVKPVGMPWASGLYKYQPAPEEPPKIKVIRKKCKCRCKKIDVKSDSNEQEDTCSANSSTSSTSSTKQIITFMEVFCSLLAMAKKDSGKKSINGSAKSSLSFCCNN